MRRLGCPAATSARVPVSPTVSCVGRAHSTTSGRVHSERGEVELLDMRPLHGRRHHGLRHGSRRHGRVEGELRLGGGRDGRIVAGGGVGGGAGTPGQREAEGGGPGGGWEREGREGWTRGRTTPAHHAPTACERRGRGREAKRLLSRGDAPWWLASVTTGRRG